MAARMSQRSIDREDVLAVESTSDVRGDQKRWAERASVSAQLTEVDGEKLRTEVAFLGTRRASIKPLPARQLPTGHGVDRLIARVGDSAQETAFDDTPAATIPPIDPFAYTAQRSLETA
ncbi:hypothetical protein [Halorhabdus sp. CUG00001]|uniref:hypothetical protein n=1 Tax=Halorhabdus sp. CUG00001 TaxID=2600297 RepID=UPI00131C01CF|nr:hypothetical protein [Halorhabdus sp. CUG00001]